MRPVGLVVATVLAVLAAAPSSAQTGGRFEERPLAGTASVSLSIPLDASLTPRQWIEMGAVALTGVGHLAASAYDLNAAYIPVAVGGWGGYVGYRTATEPGYLRRMGFTGENLGPAFRDASILAGVSLGVMAGIGAAQGTLDVDTDLLPLLALYPAWGLLQQFLVQGLVAGNLSQLDGAVGSPYAVTPITALVFGSVHVPNWRLTAATTSLALAYTPMYLRHRNLWPLGLYHGWLGAVFYRWVLDRNPWQELVGE